LEKEYSGGQHFPNAILSQHPGVAVQQQAMEQQTSPKVIVLLGKLGHGKTRLVNLLCGTNFPSSMTAGSCTTKVQRGTTKKYGIHVIDTPGFESSDDTCRHTEYQTEALESCELSGVYIIVKHGRLGDMASTAGMIMDFADTEEPRIIVTFVDCTNPTSEEASVHDDAKGQLAMMLDVGTEHIMMVGAHTSKEELEAFLQSTLLLPSKRFHVSADFKALANAQQVGARRAIVLMKALSESLTSQDRAAILLNQNSLIELAHSLTGEERQVLISRLRETFRSQHFDTVIRSILVQFDRPTTHSPKRKLIPGKEVDALAEESMSKKYKPPQRDAATPNIADTDVIAGTPPRKQSLDRFAEPPPPKSYFETEQTVVEQLGLHHRYTNNGVTASSSIQELDAMERGEGLQTSFLSLDDADENAKTNNCQKKAPISPPRSSSSTVVETVLCIAASIVIVGAVGVIFSHQS
jgi:50S ribosome-binding GTPase